MAVLIVVGLARSGKDTAADYIAKKYGYQKYTFSSVLSEMIEERGEKPTKEKMLNLGDSLRKKMGMDAIAQLLEKKITQHDNILLLGPRSIEEIEYFRKIFPQIWIIKIVAGSDERFLRRSKIDPSQKKEFLERDKQDSKTKGLEKVLQEAKIEIKNQSSKKDFYLQIENLMQKIQ